MKKASRKPWEYHFSKNIPPKIRVEPHEKFAIRTEDCFSGRIRKPGDLPIPEVITELLVTPPEINPISGPVYIEGAEKGDVLVVNIIDVIPDLELGQGVTAVLPGFGPLKDSAAWPECHGPSVHFIKHLPGPSGTLSDGKGVFNSRISWDLKPFFGTIGVAPEHEAISSLTGPYVGAKGAWGGNWDARDVCKGSKVYLPVYVKGALLFAGDLHATQGDAEYCGVADECPGEGVFSCEIIKKKMIPYARIEKANSIIQLNNGRPLERTITEAFIWMMDWLVKDYKFGRLEAYEFISVCPDVRINVYQMVPENHYTIGVEIPKGYLSS